MPVQWFSAGSANARRDEDLGDKQQGQQGQAQGQGQGGQGQRQGHEGRGGDADEDQEDTERLLHDAEEKHRQEQAEGRSWAARGIRWGLLLMTVGGAVYVAQDPGPVTAQAMLFLLEHFDYDWPLWGLMLAASADSTRELLLTNGGVDTLLQLSKESAERARVALAVLTQICQSTSHRDRVAMNTAIADTIVELLRNFGINEDIASCRVAFECLYFLLPSEEFKVRFRALHGWQLLIEAAKSKEPEIQAIATQLVGTFLLAHPTLLAQLNLKKKPDELGIVFGALTNSAGRYQEEGQHAAAVEAYELALKVDPSNIGLMNQVGSELQKLGDRDEAAKYLLMSLAVEPMQVEPAFHLAAILCAKSQDPETLRQAAKILKGGLEELRHVRNIGPSHYTGTRAYSLLVNVYERLEENELAISRAQEWSLRFPTHPLSHAALGRLLWEEGSLREALFSLDNSLKLNPTQANLHFLRANCLLKLNREEEGVEALERAVEWDMKNRFEKSNPVAYLDKMSLERTLWVPAEALVQLSGFYLQKKQYQKAQELLVRLNNGKTEYKFTRPELAALGQWRLAVCREHLGQREAAYDTYGKALDAIKENQKKQLQAVRNNSNGGKKQVSGKKNSGASSGDEQSNLERRAVDLIVERCARGAEYKVRLNLTASEIEAFDRMCVKSGTAL